MDDRVVQIQKLLDAADGNLSSARTLVRELTATETEPLDLDKKLENLNVSDEGKVIEGVFNGEAMVAPDGQTYPIPPNYASKSKLVEGDTLKLTIADDGSFVFKQISPVERRNAIGTLALVDGNYTVSAEGKSFKILTASVTFYKAEPGDQVTILLPKEHEAFWAVLENVIKKADVSIDEPSPVSSLNEVKDPESLDPLVQPQNDVKVEQVVEETPVAIPEVVIPEPSTPVIPTIAEESPSNTPEIEFPAGAPTMSDEQLLENLKSNLKNLDQPAYVAPESQAPKPVDNIIANELDSLTNKQPVINKPATDDKPIAELDI